MGMQVKAKVERFFDALKEKVGANREGTQKEDRSPSDTSVLLLSNGNISLDNLVLTLRSDLSEWIRVLGTDVQCGKKRGRPMLCKWDRLGIEVGSDGVASNKVDFLTIYLRSELDEFMAPANQLGGARPIPDFIVRGAFPYVLQLGGIRITNATRFSEVRERSDPTMQLRCDVNDCQFPHGSFGEKAILRFVLNGRTETNTVNMVTISAVD